MLKLPKGKWNKDKTIVLLAGTGTVVVSILLRLLYDNIFG